MNTIVALAGFADPGDNSGFFYNSQTVGVLFTLLLLLLMCSFGLCNAIVLRKERRVLGTILTMLLLVFEGIFLVPFVCILGLALIGW